MKKSKTLVSKLSVTCFSQSSTVWTHLCRNHHVYKQQDIRSAGTVLIPKPGNTLGLQKQVVPVPDFEVSQHELFVLNRSIQKIKGRNKKLHLKIVTYCYAPQMNSFKTHPCTGLQIQQIEFCIISVAGCKLLATWERSVSLGMGRIQNIAEI